MSKDRKSFARKEYTETGVIFHLADNMGKMEFDSRNLPEAMLYRAAAFGLAQTLGDLTSKEEVVTVLDFIEAMEERWEQITSGEWEKRGREKMTDEQKLAMYKRMIANLEKKGAGKVEVPDIE